MGEVIELQMDIKNLRKIGTVSEKTLVPPLPGGARLIRS